LPTNAVNTSLVERDSLITGVPSVIGTGMMLPIRLKAILPVQEKNVK
jgi:hypothetical protein